MLRLHFHFVYRLGIVPITWQSIRCQSPNATERLFFFNLKTNTEAFHVLTLNKGRGNGIIKI